MEQNEKPMVSVKKHVQALGTAAAVIADPLLGEQLITKFSEMYEQPISEARRFYNREKDNFGKLISQSPALQKCTPMSAYLAFGTVMKLKLSFDNGRAPLVYLIPGKRNIGTKQQPNYIEEMIAQPSPEGEKEARISTGILKKVGQPIVVHEGDKYREYMSPESGEVVVEWERTEKSGDKIIGSFIRIVEPDGTVVFKTFKVNDIERWKHASAVKNSQWDDNARKKVIGKPNALYTSGVNNQIDEGFLKGKTLLHSFKGYKQVDYGSAEGFEPDTSEAKKINPNYTDDNFTAFEEVPKAQVGAPSDDFSQAVNEPEPEQASVSVKVEDDDDPFK
jgi:hypothetical protein